MRASLGVLANGSPQRIMQSVGCQIWLQRIRRRFFAAECQTDYRKKLVLPAPGARLMSGPCITVASPSRPILTGGKAVAKGVASEDAAMTRPYSCQSCEVGAKACPCAMFCSVRRFKTLTPENMVDMHQCAWLELSQIMCVCARTTEQLAQFG